MEKKRILWIDAVKGISILAICFIHLENWTLLFGDNQIIHSFFNRGTLGVELTYICSGILLCSKYENPNNKKEILFKSILRVIPLYYFALILFILLNVFGLLTEEPSILNTVSHFVFLNGFFPVWWDTFPGTNYMAVLVFSWIFFAFYKGKIRNFESSIIGFSIVLAVTCFLKVVLHFCCPISDTYLWNAYISYFLRGLQSFAFAPVIYYLPKESGNSFKHSKIVSYCLLMISAVCFAAALRFNVSDNIIYLCLLFPSIYSFHVIYEPKLIVNKVFCFLGKYIFGIYLGHIILYFIISNFIESGILIWVLDITLAILFSVITNFIIEKPFIRLIKKIEERFNKPVCS